MIKLTSELDAVNAILATIGEPPVSSLTADSTADVSSALSTLREVSRELQTEGWSFNTEKNYTLSLNADKEILLPSNLVRVQVCRRSDTKPVVRGSKIYDAQNHSYTFEQPLTADSIVFLLDFSELPEHARNYIYHKAARVFNQRNLGADGIQQSASRDELEARRAFLRAEAITEQLSMRMADGVQGILLR